MKKELRYGRYILKVSYADIKAARALVNGGRRTGDGLRLTIKDAAATGRLIKLADSDFMRFTDRVNGCEDKQERIEEIKRRLKRAQKRGADGASVAQLHKQLNELMFSKDIITVSFEKAEQLHKCSSGVKVNGCVYKRLVGTPNGVKRGAVIFAADRVMEDGETFLDKARRHLECSRDTSLPLVPAKYEAYKALSLSSSFPLSMPHGVVVVPDCVTTFMADYLSIDDAPDGGEPVMTHRRGEVSNVESDGYGLMTPDLAARWGAELKCKGGRLHGVCVRHAFTKGMVFPVDYKAYIRENVSGGRDFFLVRDVWGNEINIFDTELILTASMLKLWDSYAGWEDFIGKATAHGYTFAATKWYDSRPDDRRRLNYQFIQSYDLTDDDIKELADPTIDDIINGAGGGYAQTLLYLNGRAQTPRSISFAADRFAKAVSIDPRMLGDPHVRQQIAKMTAKRKDESKIGKLEVSGNFTVISGDPIALIQSVCGVTVTGVLGEGEAYSQYWAKRGVRKVAAFRAPMTCHNNIRMLNINSSKEAKRWYSYMESVTVLNAWDLTCCAMNGADKDGDIIFTTDNRLLVDKIENKPPIVCGQKKADKVIITEDALRESNGMGFGDEIGAITNRITTMFDIMEQYPPRSPEREMLQYRIMCGQKYQQDAIDRIKGIISEPMPDYWYSRRSKTARSGRLGDIDKRICADKKPYFMNYIYDARRSKYSAFVKAVDHNRRRLFGEDGATQEETSSFDRAVAERLPVIDYGGVMNRVCRYAEGRLADMAPLPEATRYSTDLIKSGAAYTEAEKKALKAAADGYLDKVRRLRVDIAVDGTRVENSDYAATRDILLEALKQQMSEICPDEKAMTDAAIDGMYGSETGRSVVWAVCGDVIIDNLLDKNKRMIHVVQYDRNGTETYSGVKYTINTLPYISEDESEEDT